MRDFLNFLVALAIALPLYAAATLLILHATG